MNRGSAHTLELVDDNLTGGYPVFKQEHYNNDTGALTGDSNFLPFVDIAKTKSGPNITEEIYNENGNRILST